MTLGRSPPGTRSRGESTELGGPALPLPLGATYSLATSKGGGAIPKKKERDSTKSNDKVSECGECSREVRGQDLAILCDIGM